MDLVSEKEEIIKWVVSLDNPAIITQINKIRKETSFDFENEWSKGVSIEDARKRTSDFIKSLPWAEK